MQRVLQDLIVALRGSGVRISVSENMDAMRAAKLVGYADRQRLKHSLSAALAKSQTEKDIFDNCFDRFFSTEGFSQPEASPSQAVEMEAAEGDSLLTQMLLAGDNTGLSMALREAAENVNMKGLRFFTQKSLYMHRILRHMGMEGLDQDIRGLLREGSSSSAQKAAKLRSGKNLLFEKVRDFVEQQFSLYAASATEEILEKYLREMRLSNLEQRDFARMHHIIRKMVKRLNSLHSRRKKSSKRGVLDLKKTLRENLAYQGMLFDPQWKFKKLDRPDIVVLCDVSRSVQAVARFMLLFLYGLNEAVARITSFIFCSNLAHVTHVFETYPVEEALIRLLKGVDVDIVFGRTDYGEVFREFKNQWLDKVSKKTTLLILGDARNNFGEPETEALMLLHERSKRVIWLNPEPPSFWGTGDSEMKRYLPFCSFARECSTVNHLERVVDFLLKYQ